MQAFRTLRKQAVGNNAVLGKVVLLFSELHSSTRNGSELWSDHPFIGELLAQANLQACPNTRRVSKVTLKWQKCTEKRMTKSKQRHCYDHCTTRLQIYKERPQRTPDAPRNQEGVECIEPGTRHKVWKGRTMKSNWWNTLHFFRSYESLAFICICHIAPTTEKPIAFKNPNLFSSTLKQQSQDKKSKRKTTQK